MPRLPRRLRYAPPELPSQEIKQILGDLNLFGTAKGRMHGQQSYRLRISCDPMSPLYRIFAGYRV